MGDAEHTPSLQVMQCMEIWGGNRPISSSVSMAGIDVEVFSRPFAGPDEAPAAGGGDVHYLSSCATGRISRMFIADVSGHGGEVAPIATNLRRLMGKYSNYIDQRRFVEAVNERFHELRDEADRYSGLFATALVATYFSPTDELTISNAGHPRPLWRRSGDGPGERGVWEPVGFESGTGEGRSAGPANLPLGVLENVSFDQRSIRIGERDLVLMYTDALVEIAGPDGRQLGETGLAAMLNSIGGVDSTTLLERLRAELGAFAGTGRADPSFHDDATMLLIGRNMRKPRPSPLLAAQAGVRIAARAAGSALGAERPLSLPQLRVDSIFGAMAQRFNRRGPTTGREPTDRAGA